MYGITQPGIANLGGQRTVAADRAAARKRTSQGHV
jgi:hypothetical protein